MHDGHGTLIKWSSRWKRKIEEKETLEGKLHEAYFCNIEPLLGKEKLKKKKRSKVSYMKLTFAILNPCLGEEGNGIDGFMDVVKGRNTGKGSAKSVDKGVCYWVGRNGMNATSAIALDAAICLRRKNEDLAILGYPKGDREEEGEE